jgi:RNA polymerase sigma-70 factor (ECF subfamily)
VRAGNDDEFTDLVRRYKEQVIRLAVSILGPAHAGEAEDLAQEVFVQVYRKLDTFRRDSALSTWLYRVTRNRAIDRRRLARMKRPHVGDESLGTLKAPEANSDPERITVAGERRARVLEHLERLPDTQRAVIYLHYWMDAGVDEIARMLEMKAGTVKSHLFRARQRLARDLAGEVQSDV